MKSTKQKVADVKAKYPANDRARRRILQAVRSGESTYKTNRMIDLAIYNRENWRWNGGAL